MTAPTPELPGGQVTIADLFRVLSQMSSQLATVVTKLEVIDARNLNADEIHRDHETRIRAFEEKMPKAACMRLAALEASRYKLAGATVALSVLAGGGAGWIALLSAHH